MTSLILEAKEDNDSHGGVVTCVCSNVPKGLGEPWYVFISCQNLIPQKKDFWRENVDTSS